MGLNPPSPPMGFTGVTLNGQPAPRYVESYVPIRDADAMHLVLYRCPDCRRLWLINAQARPVDERQQHEFILDKLIGRTHFKGARRSWTMCYILPHQVDDDPAVLAAFHMGGPDAVEAINYANHYAQAK